MRTNHFRWSFPDVHYLTQKPINMNENALPFETFFKKYHNRISYYQVKKTYDTRIF